MVVSREWRKDSKVREEGKCCAYMVSRMRGMNRRVRQGLVDVGLHVECVHSIALDKAIVENQGSNFLLELVRKVSLEP